MFANHRKFFIHALAACFALSSCARIKPQSVKFSSEKARNAGLVEVTPIAPDIIVNLRYGTLQNIANRPLYPADMPCLLRPKTLQKLLIAQQFLRSRGYRLIVWDAYRPPQTQQDLWDTAPIKDFVANPAWGWSGHCCGIAVDVSLADANGRQMKMPTDFDHFGPESYSNFKGNTPEVAANLKILRAAMLGAGFDGHLGEWWHFEDSDYLPLSADQVVFAPSLGIVLPTLPPKNL